MKAIILTATAATATVIALSSCTTTCVDCRTLPVPGTYNVCAAEGPGSEHIKVDDKILIGRVGNVTKVAFGPRGDERRTRLQMFQGSGGLVGWVPKDGHDEHVLTIGTIRLTRDVGRCKAGPVISVEFAEPDREGRYQKGDSTPHYGHIHGEIESLVPPSI